MNRWRMTLNVRDVFYDDDLTTAAKAQAIAARIRIHPWARENDYVRDLADELAEQTDTHGFDVVWHAIYDEADADRVWVATV